MEIDFGRDIVFGIPLGAWSLDTPKFIGDCARKGTIRSHQSSPK